MRIHVVAPGETVNSIALLYAVPPEEIILDNRLAQPDDLVVGQTLVILGAGGQGRSGVLAMNGYAYPYIDGTILEETLPYLSSLTLFTYGFTPGGELVTIDDAAALSAAGNAGVTPIMLISTLGEDGRFSNELASALLNNEEAQRTLLASIISVMQEKGYRALDIDFEYIYPEDAPKYVEFVRLARQTLSPYGYFVVVALAPKTSDDQPGLLYEGHDYAGLGEAADYVLLMTYEWGYTYGPPLPVAPLNRVREVVEYAVSRIPTGKILMGMPNYGYDWTLPYIAGESKARSIGNEQAVDIARDVGADILYDETAQSPHFGYVRDGKEHVVWFEDARSVRAKLALAAEFGLFGVSVWNIMRYFTQMWLVYDSLYFKRPWG